MSQNEVQPGQRSLQRDTSQRDIILLDCSSSMLGQWNDICKAIDAYVQTLQWDKVNTNITLVGFSKGHMDVVYRDCHIQDWQPLTHQHVSTISPHGGTTPLYDGINMSCWRLRDEAPTRATLTIATDGDENASTFTSLDDASAYLDWARARGYQVTFLGCDFNNEKLAGGLGAKPENTIAVQRALLSDAMTNLAKKRAKYGLYGTDMHFSDDERDTFAGYLSDQSGDKSND